MNRLFKRTIAICSIFCLLTAISFANLSENAYAKRSKIEYIGGVFYRTVGGYAGNNAPGGTRFPTGGGFYWSDKGGPTASVSVSLGAGFGSVSVGTELGKKSSSGEFVTVPNKKDYFKLYIEKTLECRKYKVLVWKWSPKEKKYCWVETSRNVEKRVFSRSPYAKKVG
ncbi:MAG: hypothetical protein IKE52_01290 [Mogibacterium sp.]|nr:hypothetical protein [Mogibacterium sp.]